MGVDDEDQDEVNSLNIQKLVQVWLHDEDDDDDDSDDDFSDDEELQTPIDEVDPFIFFVGTPAVQASDPARFQSLMQTLDFHYQALANGVAQHAEERKVEIEKEKLEKANAQ
ncbi:unnamed protein product [Triticum turgidum subsp. durum]|uniref:Uncharacterized protein n=1 Tax=Triticum turgidum subsp. durum TaxID=4567 RepID=A0A9R1R7X1_TRITD|nr:unnamed protein product [Triticum turgidum subsp. durum]